jgi:hypothetical protein
MKQHPKHLKMKLKFLSVILCLFSALSAQNAVIRHSIGSIEKRGSWYDIYNERGKK